jgi:hypothetical protein
VTERVLVQPDFTKGVHDAFPNSYLGLEVFRDPLTLFGFVSRRPIPGVTRAVESL